MTGLIPGMYGFTDYSTSNEELTTLKTITKSSLLSEQTVDENVEEEEKR